MSKSRAPAQEPSEIPSQRERIRSHMKMVIEQLEGILIELKDVAKELREACVFCGDLQVSGNYHFPRPELEYNINVILKRTQQRMYFLCQLRKHGLLQELLIQFYTAVIGSVLCTSITI